MPATRTPVFAHSFEQEPLTPMHVIGVDPHKLSHTATAVDSTTNTDLGSVRIPASAEGYTQLWGWAGQWPQRVWAVENAKGLGHNLAQWLIRNGETVVDIPSTATARVRELSRGGRRKTDRIDAAAVAYVAFSQGDYRPVEADDDRAIIELLEQRRTDVTRQFTRVLNQLHALLRDLTPGGVDTRCSVEQIRTLVRQQEPVTAADEMRKTLALEIIGDLRRLQYQLDDLKDRIAAQVTAAHTTLLTIFGIGELTAARIIARVGNPARFDSEAAFASYTGTAPIEISSGERHRHRLSRSGDRQLNSVIHSIAVCQARYASSPGYAYYHRKLDDGKTPREARRCLKRQITKHIWRALTTDHQRSVEISDADVA